MNKYHAQRCTMDGLNFASLREMERYCQLKLLQQAGEISGLRCQPRYLLQPGYIASTGERVRPIHYVGDFEYRESGRLCVEDVKGMATQVYLLKKKMFQHRYPAIQFREVR